MSTIVAIATVTWTASLDPRTTRYEVQLNEAPFGEIAVGGEMKFEAPLPAGTSGDVVARVRAGGDAGLVSDWVSAGPITIPLGAPSDVRLMISIMATP